MGPTRRFRRRRPSALIRSEKASNSLIDVAKIPRTKKHLSRSLPHAELQQPRLDMAVKIRKIEARDRARWGKLWDGYCRFYELDLSGPITQHTWARIMDPASPVHAIVAERPRNGVIGMANYILHENTWTLTPVCYLEDLFVDPKMRAAGVGEALIDWLVREMRRRKWSRMYWHTRETNYRARGLYDKYTAHSGFLRYVLTHP